MNKHSRIIVTYFTALGTLGTLNDFRCPLIGGVSIIACAGYRRPTLGDVPFPPDVDSARVQSVSTEYLPSLRFPNTMCTVLGFIN